MVYTIVSLAAAASPTLSARARAAAEIAPQAARIEIVALEHAGYTWAAGHLVWPSREYDWVGRDYPGNRREHHWVADHLDQESYY